MTDRWALGASLTALVLVILSHTVAPTRAWALTLALTAFGLNGWACWRVGRVWWARRSSRRSIRHLVRSEAPPGTWGREAWKALHRMGARAQACRREVGETLRALTDEPAGPREAIVRALRYRVEAVRPEAGTTWRFLGRQESEG